MMEVIVLFGVIAFLSLNDFKEYPLLEKNKMIIIMVLSVYVLLMDKSKWTKVESSDVVSSF